MRGATAPKVNRLKVNDDKNAGRYCHERSFMGGNDVKVRHKVWAGA
jgi:hypothetical protein